MILSVSIAMLAVLLTLSSGEALAAERTHIVVRGDTIFSLARAHGVSQEELMRHNGLTDPAQLRAGMRLSIPSAQPSAAEHIVAPGETLFSIARGWGVTLQALRDINGFSQDRVLRAGERIRIPQSARVAAPPQPPLAPPNIAHLTEHTVAPGETLFGIAQANGITLQALRDINGFSQNCVLRAGERIKIPAQAAIATVPTVLPTETRVNTGSVTWSQQMQLTTGRMADPSLRWPVHAMEVAYMSGNTGGVLVLGRESESVRSVSRGTVIFVGPWRGFGNVVIVESVGGFRFLYGANESLSVRVGDSVEPGTEVGKLGLHPATGRPELVFIVSRDGMPVDPATAPRS